MSRQSVLWMLLRASSKSCQQSAKGAAWAHAASNRMSWQDRHSTLALAVAQLKMQGQAGRMETAATGDTALAASFARVHSGAGCSTSGSSQPRAQRPHILHTFTSSFQDHCRKAPGGLRHHASQSLGRIGPGGGVSAF